VPFQLVIYSITHPREYISVLQDTVFKLKGINCVLSMTKHHTEADSTNMRSRYSDSERGNYSDHEVDYVHPVVIWRDVCVAYAAGIINDERNVQQTC